MLLSETDSLLWNIYIYFICCWNGYHGVYRNSERFVLKIILKYVGRNDACNIFLWYPKENSRMYWGNLWVVNKKEKKVLWKYWQFLKFSTERKTTTKNSWRKQEMLTRSANLNIWKKPILFCHLLATPVGRSDKVTGT